MKADDLVMFKPEGIYAEWFGGQFGIVVGTSYAKDGNLYCRVKWLQAIKYHNRTVGFSNFAASRFEVYER